MQVSIKILIPKLGAVAAQMKSASLGLIIAL